jgi:hypothetical protein
MHLSHLEQVRHAAPPLPEKLLGKPSSPQNGWFSPARYWPILPARRHGWLWTDRADLVHLTEANKDGSGDPKPIPQDDQRFKDYMEVYNRQAIVMAQIWGPQRYRELTGRIRPMLDQRGRDATHLALPGPNSGTGPQVKPSDAS